MLSAAHCTGRCGENCWIYFLLGYPSPRTARAIAARATNSAMWSQGRSASIATWSIAS